MRQMSKSMKLLSAAALGLAMLGSQSRADQPNVSGPPAPAKTVVPKTTKDTGKVAKDAKKVTKKVTKGKDAKKVTKVAKGTRDVKKVTKGIKGTRGTQEKTADGTRKVIRTARDKVKDRTTADRIVPPGTGR